jgi:hypothetical protein
MEKENFYSIVDEMCSFNFKSYFENSEWYKESLASQVDIDSPQIENKGALREEIISHMEDLHKRKLKLFEKKFKSYQELESKEPHLILVPNHPAERFVYIKYINWEKYDPASNPNELINLAKELQRKKFEEVFYQPTNEKFMKNLEDFIKSKITLSPKETLVAVESKMDKKLLLELNEKIEAIEKEKEKEAKEQIEEKDKEKEKKEEGERGIPQPPAFEEKEKEKEKEKSIKEIKKDILIAALDVYFILNIYQGNYIRISDFHNFMKESNYSRYKDYLSKNFSFVEAVLKNTLNTLFLSDNNYQPYPIMRNWAINDVFNMTKNLLFIQNKGNYSMEKLPSTAICTDSKYLYIILYGICGGIYKVGTGKNGTIKGHIYAKNIVVNTIENNPMMVYVKNSKRIYLKTNQNKIGHIKVIDPENLTVEKIINLNIPQSAKGKTVSEKNQNYILLSDDNYLYTIMLEEKESKKKENNEFGTEPSFKYNNFYNEKRIRKKDYYMGSYSYVDVSLCLYQYSLNESIQTPIETENDKLVNELFESFSYVFPKERCKYALEKKGYDIERAADFLIKLSQEKKQIEIKVKQPEQLYKNYEICSKVIIFESKLKLDNINKPNDLVMTPEYKTKFDPSKFDCLKWCLAKNKLYAYKFKDGGCFVFGTNKKDEKEFTIEVNEQFGEELKKPFIYKQYGSGIKNVLMNKYYDFQNKLLNDKNYNLTDNEKKEIMDKIEENERKNELKEKKRKYDFSDNENEKYRIVERIKFIKQERNRIIQARKNKIKDENYH